MADRKISRNERLQSGAATNIFTRPVEVTGGIPSGGTVDAGGEKNGFVYSKLSIMLYGVPKNMIDFWMLN